MKIDFSKMVQKDIDGEIESNNRLYKTVAHVLWTSAKNLDLVETAMAINRGEEVDMSSKEVAELKVLIQNAKNQVFAFAQKQILDFIKKVEEENNGD